MGSTVICCNRLLSYFRCEAASAQGEAERSPLLSSEESESNSPSLLDNLEDELITVCTGVTNPALQPENFLFPDIILSSHLGGDVTLVEPMVCLLVSEEDDGETVEDLQERSNTDRNRRYSEVETQMERETEIDTEVQTQTESQAEVENEMVVGDTLTKTATTKKMGEDEMLKPKQTL